MPTTLLKKIGYSLVSLHTLSFFIALFTTWHTILINFFLPPPTHEKVSFTRAGILSIWFSILFSASRAMSAYTKCTQNISWINKYKERFQRSGFSGRVRAGIRLQKVKKYEVIFVSQYIFSTSVHWKILKAMTP